MSRGSWISPSRVPGVDHQLVLKTVLVQPGRRGQVVRPAFPVPGQAVRRALGKGEIFFGFAWHSVPLFKFMVTKKRAAFSGHSLMESMVVYSCFAANFSTISSRRSKVCFSSGYQDHFFAGYDFFRAIVYDTILVDNHRRTHFSSTLTP